MLVTENDLNNFTICLPTLGDSLSSSITMAYRENEQGF